MVLTSFATVIHAIYRAAAEPEYWGRALEAIADHVGAIGALIAYHDFGTDEGFLTVGNLRDDLTDLYVDRYGRNHYSVAITQQPAQIPFVGQALIDPDIARRTAMHADIWVPQKIVEHVMIGHAPFIKNETTGGTAVMLDARQADGATHVARRFGRLAPHLSSAIELTRTVQRQRSHERQRQWLLDALPGAALLLDAAGRLVETNRLGEALLSAGDAFTARAGGRIAAAIPDEDRRLAALLKRAAGAGDDIGPGGLWMRLRRRVGAALAVRATPLPRAAFANWDITERGAAILLQVQDPARTIDPSALRARYGMTEAEARVAALIGVGRSTPEVSQALGVSVNTIRTHLARCFDKTGVRSQVDLARLIAGLPI